MEYKLQMTGKYLQGSGLMTELATNVTCFGKKALYLLVNRDVDSMIEKIEKSYESLMNDDLNKLDIYYRFEIFEGECCKEEISRLVDIIDEYQLDVIVGLGSGKVHDTAKAVGYYTELPVVIIPTIAASDAPCSSMSVIYTKEGLFDHYLYLDKNPDMVFVDTDFIVQAPERLLVAGMGDALSTYYEARACQKSGCILPNGASSNDIAFQLSKLCLDNIYEYGILAKKDVQNKRNSKAVDKIIEANTFLSGIGFENGGLAAAHAINDGMSKISMCNHRLHGEKVAFATIVQLILEEMHCNREKTVENVISDEQSKVTLEIERLIDFCKRVGLPVTLEEMGLTSDDRDTLSLIAGYSRSEEEPIHHMEFNISDEMIIDALLEADKRGRQ